MNQLHYTLYKNSWVYSGPIDDEKRLSKDEMKSLLSKGGLMVRNVYDFDTEESSFWFIVKDANDSLDDFRGHTTKRRIRKSLSNLTFERVDKKLFSLDEAYSVMKENFLFYKTKERVPSFDKFKERILLMDDSYDIWTARLKTTNEMVAWAIRKRYKESCEYQSIKAHPKFFTTCYPFYGMYYVCNEYYLKTLKLKFVSDGARSVTTHSNIQNFLIEKFNFRKAYCHLNVVYQWWLTPIVKLLFPFRKFVPKGRVKSLLNLEAMKRGLL